MAICNERARATRQKRYRSKWCAPTRHAFAALITHPSGSPRRLRSTSTRRAICGGARSRTALTAISIIAVPDVCRITAGDKPFLPDEDAPHHLVRWGVLGFVVVAALVVALSFAIGPYYAATP